MNKLTPCFLGGEEEEASAHSSSILEALSAVLTRPGWQESSAFYESLLVTPILLFIYLFIYLFLFVVNFVIHWNETAMGLHVFPIPIPPPTSRSTRSP